MRREEEQGLNIEVGPKKDKEAKEAQREVGTGPQGPRCVSTANLPRPQRAPPSQIYWEML